jgi:hypothetical protein
VPMNELRRHCDGNDSRPIQHEFSDRAPQDSLASIRPRH